MKRRLLTIAIATLMALAAFAIPSSSTPTAQCATGDCEMDCYAAESTCRAAGQGRYNYCRSQEGRSEQDCARERGRVYNECMDARGRERCIDYRTIVTWFCRCGRYGQKPIYLENYDYYEENEVPFQYTWEGMGCDTNPEICDPTLWL